MKYFTTSIAMVVITAIASLFSCKGFAVKEDITISDLKTRQSIFADSMVTLHDVRIEACTSLLNYSKAEISDKSGEKITFISDKPFRVGEITDIDGSLLVLYQFDHDQCIVFVHQDLKPLSELTHLVKGLLLL